MGSLTDRQRRYAALTAAGRTPLEAMAAAGYGLKCRRRWLARNQADARIAALVTRLRAGWADDAPAAVSKHGITRMLAADRRLAYREGAPGAAVAASVAIARINGWIADSRHPAPKPLAEMGDAELQRYLLALAAPGGPAAAAGDVAPETNDAGPAAGRSDDDR